MKELKVDPELRDLLPHLKKERYDKLEEMIIQEGYDGTPILVWNNYIVDGHHRYEIFKRHHIDFNVEEISIDKNADKSEIMGWMKAYQNARRNMSDAESIFVEKKISEARLREENEKKKLEGNALGADITNGKTVCAQMDAERNTRDRSTNTREQIAKAANVSTGTVSRYDRVVNAADSSNDEELTEIKDSMISGEIPIGTAYRKVKEKENQKKSASTTTATNAHKKDSTPPVPIIKDTQTEKICDFMKTERTGDFNYNIDADVKSLEYIFNKNISEINDSIFNNHELMSSLNNNIIEIILGFLNNTKKNLEKIISDMEELKNE